MGLPLNYNIRVFAAKQEVTPGTGVSLANTDAGFRAFEPKLEIVQGYVQRQTSGNLGVDSGVAAEKSTTVSFKNRVNGAGSAGTPPSFASILLPCCGLPGTANSGGTSMTYAGTSDASQWKTATCGLYQNGRKKLAVGVMFNAKFMFQSGKPVEIDWDGKGNWPGDPSDASILTGMTYETPTPPLFAASGSFNMGTGNTYPISKCELDLGNDVQLREDANSTGGYISAYIANRIGKVTLDPEAQLFATKNWHAGMTANATPTITLVAGTAGGNTMTITATLQQNKAPEDQERTGKLVDSLSFDIINDSISIVFT